MSDAFRHATCKRFAEQSDGLFKEGERCLAEARKEGEQA